MNRSIVFAMLVASVSLMPVRHTAAEQPKKGAPAATAGTSATSADQGPVVVLSALKPGVAVRVKAHNVWTDGKVVQVSGSQIQVQIGGNKDWFEAEKVWGTDEARDNEAAGGYLQPNVREAFERFKVVVDKLEAAKQGGADAQTLADAIDEAEQVRTAEFGAAQRHPRVGPVLARYWAVATVRCDQRAASAVAEAEHAVETSDFNYFVGFTYGAWSRAEAWLTEYKTFQTTANAETARLEQVLADARQKIDAARATLAQAALAATRVPKETYKGADKKALKAKITALWKAAHRDRPILKLVISTDWDQVRTWNTNASAAGGYWYDWTSLVIALVVKKDATLATIYPVGVSYQDGNKKKLIFSVTDQGFHNYSPYDMLLKNVK